MRNPSAAAWALAAVALSSAAGAQTPMPPKPAESLTFQEAVARAIEKNPSAAVAAAGILRAQALLSETRAGTRLQVNGNVNTTTLNTGVEFDGQVVSPRNSVVAALDVRMPLFAAAQWARRAQAEDQKNVAELSAGRNAPADRARHRRRVPVDHRAAARRRSRRARARHGEGALRSRVRARAAGERQPAERAARAAGAVDRRRAGRVGASGALPRAGGARRAARRRRPGGCRRGPGVRSAGRRAAADRRRLLQFRTDLKLFSAEQQAADARPVRQLEGLLAVARPPSSSRRRRTRRALPPAEPLAVPAADLRSAVGQRAAQGTARRAAGGARRHGREARRRPDAGEGRGADGARSRRRAPSAASRARGRRPTRRTRSWTSPTSAFAPAPRPTSR